VLPVVALMPITPFRCLIYLEEKKKKELVNKKDV